SDRAATLADRTDRNGRDEDLELADQFTHTVLWLAVHYDRHVGARSANVEAHASRNIGHLGNVAGADHTGSGARQYHLDTFFLALLRSHYAAIRLGKTGISADPGLGERALQGGEIMRDAWLYVAADHRRYGAFVLSDDRPGFRGAEHGQFRLNLFDDGARLF